MVWRRGCWWQQVHSMHCCPLGEISWADVAQLEVALREISWLWWLGMLRQHPTLAGARQHPLCLSQQQQQQSTT